MGRKVERAFSLTQSHWRKRVLTTDSHWVRHALRLCVNQQTPRRPHAQGVKLAFALGASCVVCPRKGKGATSHAGHARNNVTCFVPT